MKSSNLKSTLGLAAAVLVVVGLTGCDNTPAATPIEQRKPGQDISAQDRAEKRGDMAVSGAPAGAGTPDGAAPPPAEPSAAGANGTPPTPSNTDPQPPETPAVGGK